MGFPTSLADPSSLWFLLVASFALSLALVVAAVVAVGKLGEALLQRIELLLEFGCTHVARTWCHWRAGTVVGV